MHHVHYRYCTLLYIMTLSAHLHGPVTQLRVTQYLEGPDGSSRGTSRAALIILNSPIEDYRYFARLRSHSVFTVCADGGANRLFDLVASRGQGFPLSTALDVARPDLIHGDLDSLEPHVRRAYASLGVEISHDPDQYSTDLSKAVRKILEKVEGVEEILILGSVGGRVDQGIGVLHELHREQTVRHPGLRFWLFSEASISTVLHMGTTCIHTPLKDGLIRRNIGILPLYGKAMISTQGLEWDVQDWATEMGGMVSTSNHIMADEITITCDKEVLFTVERGLIRK